MLSLQNEIYFFKKNYYYSRAASKFHEVLQAMNEVEADALKMQYVLYEVCLNQIPLIFII